MIYILRQRQWRVETETRAKVESRKDGGVRDGQTEGGDSSRIVLILAHHPIVRPSPVVSSFFSAPYQRFAYSGTFQTSVISSPSFFSFNILPFSNRVLDVYTGFSFWLLRPNDTVQAGYS